MSQQYVVIKDGHYRGNVITGTFPLHTRARKSYMPAPSGVEKTHKVEIYDSSNKKIGVWVNETDVEYMTGTDILQKEVMKEVQSLSDVVLHNAIAERFDMLDLLTEGVIAGHVKSMIVSGSPGVGKTFTLNKNMKKAEEQGRINSYTLFGGHVSPLGLYQFLYEHSAEGDVIVLDDSDGIFGNEDSIGLLKIALDTGDERVLRWLSHSRLLEDNDIPTEFTYEGSIVFISNMDFEAIIGSGTKIAPHVEALMSRSVFLDLLIHGVRETLIRIEQVVTTTDMLDRVGLTEMEDKLAIMNWLKTNVNHLRSISLREVLRLATFYQMDNSRWIDIAQATLFKPAAQRRIMLERSR